MYEEHIEEMLNLHKANSKDPINPNDIAMGVADIVCAQGYEDPQSDMEFDLLVQNIAQQVQFYMTNGEIVRSKKAGLM